MSQLHDASLLIDDVEDGSAVRQGPASHAVFGIASTINAANYMYFVALESCLSLRSDAAVSREGEYSLECARGV